MTAIVIVLIINFLMLAANVVMFLGNKDMTDRIGQIVLRLDEREIKEI